MRATWSRPVGGNLAVITFVLLELILTSHPSIAERLMDKSDTTFTYESRSPENGPLFLGSPGTPSSDATIAMQQRACCQAHGLPGLFDDVVHRDSGMSTMDIPPVTVTVTLRFASSPVSVAWKCRYRVSG